MEMYREWIAYGLIAAILAIGIPWLIVVAVRRKREKIRRRGIKNYGR
jgi:hypothetical protein